MASPSNEQLKQQQEANRERVAQLIDRAATHKLALEACREELIALFSSSAPAQAKPSRKRAKAMPPKKVKRRRGPKHWREMSGKERAAFKAKKAATAKNKKQPKAKLTMSTATALADGVAEAKPVEKEVLKGMTIRRKAKPNGSDVTSVEVPQ